MLSYYYRRCPRNLNSRSRFPHTRLIHSIHVPLPTPAPHGRDVQAHQYPRFSSALIGLEENILVTPLLGKTSQICFLSDAASKRALIATGMAHTSVSARFCHQAEAPLVEAAHSAHVATAKGDRRGHMARPTLSSWAGSV